MTKAPAKKPVLAAVPANDAPVAASRPPEVLIEVRGLLSQFGEQVIHQDLDLDVLRGEVHTNL